MKYLCSLFTLGILLTACHTTPIQETQNPSQSWHPSTLKEDTQKQVYEALRQYEQCLDKETQAHLYDREDSRRIADGILKQCEEKLSAVKIPLQLEQVPDALADRYLMSKRSRAAQNIMRIVMATQAMRQSQ